MSTGILPGPCPNSDYYRDRTYCPFCGHPWKDGSQSNMCIKTRSEVGPGDVVDYYYHRRGPCYERQIAKLQHHLELEVLMKQATLDKIANLRNALKELNIN